MRKTLSILLVFPLVFSIFLFQSCDKKQDNILRIGAILPETGKLSQLGIPKKEAFLLAQGQINANGGIRSKKMEIILGDNKGEPKTGVSEFRRLIDFNKIKYFYVDITAVANACIPIADQTHSIMFAGSAHPAITNGSDWVFRVFTSGDLETTILADYLASQKVKTIFILHSNEVLGEYSREYLNKKFTDKGGEVLGSDAFNVGQKDCKNILIKAKDSNADKIVLIGYGVTFPTLIQQINELGIKRNKIVGNIGFVGPRVANLDPELVKNIVFTGPSFAYKSKKPDTKNMAEFVKMYKEKYSKNPDYTAAFAYDTIMILKKVISENGFDNERVREGLLKLKNYPGVSGSISFLPNGDTITDTEIMTYQDGKIIPVKM